MNFKLLIGLFLVICAGRVNSVEMKFSAAFDHKFVFTNTNGVLLEGFSPDTPELQNACNPWVGFYAEFTVDYARFNQTAGLSIGGGGVKVCFQNTTEFKDTHKEVFVTDLLKQTKLWPTVGSPGELSPSVTNETLYKSPNGFNTNFNQGKDKNQWCLSGGGFGKFMDAFNGKANYIFGVSVSLASYDKCVNTSPYTVFFQQNGGELTLTSGGKKKSKFWMWLLIIVIGIVVVGGGIFVYMKKSGGDGGFSKV